jgi:hypothetical protein
MKQYIFKPHVYKKPFAPHYDSYKNHLFHIIGYHPEAEDHVYLKCSDDPSIIVDGYVDLGDLYALGS